MDVEAGKHHVAATDSAERQPVAAASGKQSLQSRQVEGKRPEVKAVAANGEVGDHIGCGAWSVGRCAVTAEDEHVVTCPAVIRSAPAPPTTHSLAVTET